MDDLDEFLDELIGKPQPKKAEVSFLPEQKPYEEDPLDPVWSKVPARKRNPTCGTCRKKLKGGEWHWRYDSGPPIGEPNKKHEIYWWCSNCIPKPNEN